MLQVPVTKSRNRRIFLAAGAGMAQRLVQVAASLATLPLVLHALGVAGFGIWAAATSLAWLTNMFDLGLGSALVSLLAGNTPREQHSDYVTASLHGGSVLAMLVLAAGAATLASGVVDVPSTPFLIAGIAIALNIPLCISNEIWLGLQKAYYASLWQLAQTLVTLALLVTGALCRANISEMTAMVYGSMLLTNALSLVHVLLLHPWLRPHGFPRRAALRTVITQGGLLFAITVAASCAYAFDNALALAWLGPVASAQMAIAMRVCTTAISMLSVLTQPLWPGFADAVAMADHGWIARIFRQGTLVLMAMALAGSTLIVLYGAPVLRWWLHQDLHISRSLLVAMAAWIITAALCHVPGLYLNATLRLKPQIIILGITAALGFPLKYLAAQTFGVIGILTISPLLWLGFVAPCYFWLARDALSRAS